MTAAEFMASLQGDPEWVQQDNEREFHQKVAIAQLQKELEPEVAPLLAELAKAGCAVGSVWELVNCTDKYPEAIPTLTMHLRTARHPVLRQGIARALTVEEARGVAGETILKELTSQADPAGSEERWALANALIVTADESMIGQLEALVSNPDFRDVHERLKTALRRMGIR